MPACLLLLLSTAGTLAAPGHSGALMVPQCSNIELKAAYLAIVAPGTGPGFLLTLSNSSDRAIKVAKPFPTSAHWYEQVGGRWLWRASSGSGGALVDALRERGPVTVYRAASASMPSAAKPMEYVTVAAHDHVEWAESMKENPALRFRPGCQRCSNAGEGRFEAVLAYAYLAPAGEEVDELLTCGLRSGPVVMPPLE